MHSATETAELASTHATSPLAFDLFGEPPNKSAVLLSRSRYADLTARINCAFTLADGDTERFRRMIPVINDGHHRRFDDMKHIHADVEATAIAPLRIDNYDGEYVHFRTPNGLCRMMPCPLT
jgi:hypothetical protein